MGILHNNYKNMYDLLVFNLLFSYICSRIAVIRSLDSLKPKLHVIWL